MSLLGSTNAGEDEVFQLKEVKVSYGNELEIILRQAATDRDFALVKKIFSDEIDLLDNWVRKRAFDYIEQGVMLKGEIGRAHV